MMLSNRLKFQLLLDRSEAHPQAIYNLTTTLPLFNYSSSVGAKVQK